ncbi:MAG: hypothetical protein Q4D29_13355, partial [Lachnospiraceae bacterium]|nr:hypothetical protein [Lachnospiraceae bacterium]
MKLIFKNKEYKTIKQVLKKEFNISNRLITVLKENNCIYRNDTLCKINTIINTNDLISINLDFSEKDNENILPKMMDLNILFEDDSLLVLNKPSNMPVHP